jgi:O-methyltransferase
LWLIRRQFFKEEIMFTGMDAARVVRRIFLTPRNSEKPQVPPTLIESSSRGTEEELFLRFPIVAPEIRELLLRHYDPVRIFSIALALQTIKRDGLAGDMAEVGVFRGDTSYLINLLLPQKRLYLFDTFEGFPVRDLEGVDTRFSNTSEEYVRSRFADVTNVVFRKGYFPDTAAGLENSTFCFVMLDADLYKPTLAAMEFFYPRTVPGGYIFAHDYTSYESNRAVSRALDRFLADKPEKLIELPDPWGSVVLRRLECLE